MNIGKNKAAEIEAEEQHSDERGSREALVKSYKESLIGGDGIGGPEKSRYEDIMSEKFHKLANETDRDFNGFEIIEEMNGDRPCPSFLISKEEERRLSKT